MARVPLVVKTGLTSAGANFDASDALISTDGLSFVNNGRVFIILRNFTAVAVDVTLKTPALFDVDLEIEERVITVPAWVTGAGDSGIAIAGIFNRAYYNQIDGTVHIDVAIGDIDKVEAMAFAI